MTILFLHGWNSTLSGKPTYLKDHGHTVLNPFVPDDDFDEAAKHDPHYWRRGKRSIIGPTERQDDFTTAGVIYGTV
jgi:hypothetical protein